MAHVLALAVFGALLGGLCGAAAAQVAIPLEESGVVTSIDDRHGVVILDGGRMVQATRATVILVDGNVATFTSLQPGTEVVIRAADPVVFRSGQYVQLSDSPAASAGGSLRARTLGRVKTVGGDGDVIIETTSGAFHIDVSPDTARMLKQDDTVTVEVIITSPGSTVR